MENAALPVEFVEHENNNQRHMEPRERIEVALRFKERFEEENQARMSRVVLPEVASEGGKAGGRGREKPLVPDPGLKAIEANDKPKRRQDYGRAIQKAADVTGLPSVPDPGRSADTEKPKRRQDYGRACGRQRRQLGPEQLIPTAMRLKERWEVELAERSWRWWTPS